MQQPIENSAYQLARRLRALRETHWPEKLITQSQLAQALSTEKPVSVPLISSWESLRNPKILPLSRLSAYATFFATKRSVAQEPFRLLNVSDLTTEELKNRSELLQELTDLRTSATQELRSHGNSASSEAADSSLWHFTDRPVTIVCAQLPADLRETMPYTNRESPQYVELYEYADPDALIEIYGHIRAINPHSVVNFRKATDLTDDDYANHLVILGGVDWNEVTRDVLQRVSLPIRQIPHKDVNPDKGAELSFFETTENTQKQIFKPTLAEAGDKVTLLKDVALFYRGPNPYNFNCTVTICNGIFARGTLGVVRAITDPRFKNANESYLLRRFRKHDSFSIITNVSLVNGKVVTPNWTAPQSRLHEWASESQWLN